MPKPIDEQRIFANNPNVDQAAVRKAIKIVKELEASGAVTRAAYGLETPETKRTLRYSEVEIRVHRSGKDRRTR